MRRMGVKLAVVAVAIGLLTRTVVGAYAADAVGLTNVTGAVGDCTAPVANGACATLFSGGQVLIPGMEPEKASVTITYHGSSETDLMGVYLSDFRSKSHASAPYCMAADPADKLDLTILQGAKILYQGTLSAFAADHHDPASALLLPGGRDGNGMREKWNPGDSSTYTILVALDLSADNPYMGCVTSADIAWFAE